ncbi:AraC family transcriptional regulator [Chryseobacterium indologenes]|uniref:AraC family transcriptional regulator n=1 Tax=Chryseobacterium indologenes TaxID=253 RepID=A0A3G5Z4C9_CHRID|nr:MULTISPECIES: AraC family transcriptional regulator [Chryseobacterium]ATN05067.1 AraC family transcriptional regulator [Chryseobacterium indologenes]AYY86180.1 AraC family transcriptional regulator [Chryseobacterium indologenes]AYZ35952.1 AraC family transcriptional regulator [Chryseobacterium indologenes]AZB16647.1 AraC family transcriptional regulator [Chryseobacterium indologenes]MBF6644737.1 helix-turn-helix transcriptional regulator [Chryseobacterium indologenes]
MLDIKPNFEGLYIEKYTTNTVSGFQQSAHKLNKLVLCFVSKGEISIRSNGCDFEVKKSSVMMLLPDTDVTDISYTNDLDFTVFFISLDFISTYSFLTVLLASDEIRFHPVIQTGNTSGRLIGSTIKLIEDYHSKTEDESTPESVQYLLYALLELVSKLYLPVIKNNSLLQTRSQDIVEHFFKLLNEHGHLQRSVIFYSDQLHLSPQYLSSFIKKETGKPIKQWISYQVIKYAKELLKTTSLSIKEVSNRLQFVDSSLFCRYFRRCTGITANTYRENYRIKK